MKKSRTLAYLGAIAALVTLAPLPAALAGEKESAACANCEGASAAVRQVSLQDIQAIVAGRQKGVIIDSRDPYAYKKGHIPGAVSLFVDDKYEGRLPKDKNTLLVFYCGGGGCALSGEAAAKAMNLGYKKVAIYKGGWSNWAQTASR